MKKRIVEYLRVSQFVQMLLRYFSAQMRMMKLKLIFNEESSSTFMKFICDAYTKNFYLQFQFENQKAFNAFSEKENI